MLRESLGRGGVDGHDPTRLQCLGQALQVGDARVARGVVDDDGDVVALTERARAGARGHVQVARPE